MYYPKKILKKPPNSSHCLLSKWRSWYIFVGENLEKYSKITWFYWFSEGQRYVLLHAPMNSSTILFSLEKLCRFIPVLVPLIPQYHNNVYACIYMCAHFCLHIWLRNMGELKCIINFIIWLLCLLIYYRNGRKKV